MHVGGVVLGVDGENDTLGFQVLQDLLALMVVLDGALAYNPCPQGIVQVAYDHFLLCQLSVHEHDVSVVGRENTAHDRWMLQRGTVVKGSGPPLAKLFRNSILVKHKKMLEALAILLLDISTNQPIDLP